MKTTRYRSLTSIASLIASFAAAIILTVGIFFPVTSSADSDVVDISWPQCSGSGVESSVGHYTAGIVGVNDGADFEINPCLGSEIAHFDGYTLYANTNYPSSGCSTQAGLTNRQNAFNCGYDVGIWDVTHACSQGAQSYIWWLDVETGTRVPWSGKYSLDQSFLTGLASALSSHAYICSNVPVADQNNVIIGYYTNPSSWASVTGNWHVPTHNENLAWFATGATTSSGAVNYCNSTGDFTGGPLVYVQYTAGIDYDASCRYR